MCETREQRQRCCSRTRRGPPTLTQWPLCLRFLFATARAQPLPQAFLFGPCEAERLCFSSSEAPSVILFFMEKWGEFITLCSCLGDHHRHSSDIKVGAPISSCKACSTHIFLRPGNGVFPSLFKPSQRGAATWLPLRTFLETQRWESGLPATAVAIKGPSSPLIFIKHLPSTL